MEAGRARRGSRGRALRLRRCRARRTLAEFPHSPRYEHCAFENFDIRKDRIQGWQIPAIRAKSAAEGFVKEYPVDFGLLFVGPTGVGKTHLAVAVLRELIIRKGVECLFYDFRDLLKKIQDSYNPVAQRPSFAYYSRCLMRRCCCWTKWLQPTPATG